MAKMIQLRHVPEALHRTLKARAALAGVPLSEYLIREVRKLAERPTTEEMRARLAARERVHARVDPTAAVRSERDAR
jgi:antitoxin FitA